MEENLPLSDKVFIMESRIINEIAEQESSFVLVGRCGNYTCSLISIFAKKRGSRKTITLIAVSFP